jgi:hypothetical protein
LSWSIDTSLVLRVLGLVFGEARRNRRFFSGVAMGALAVTVVLIPHGRAKSTSGGNFSLISLERMRYRKISFC